MSVVYTLADLNRQAAEVCAQENELDNFFIGNVTHVTITDGNKTLTVAVDKRTGMAVVHDLMLAAIEKSESLERQMGGVPAMRIGGEQETATNPFRFGA